MTERVSSGILTSKSTRWVLGALAAAYAILCIAGCAQKGSPVQPDGSEGYRIVGTLAIAGYAESVQVAGDLCVLAASQGGLVVVDLSDASAPEFLGNGATQYEATGVAYIGSDSLAFVTVGSRGVTAFDVSDPTAPAEQGNGQGVFARDIVAKEGIPGESHYLFSADGNGILIQRCEYFPSLEQWFFYQLAHEGTSGSARGIWLHDDMALLAQEELGLWIYDVSELTAPALLGSVDTPGEARAVTTDGQYAYVADWRKGLQVVDISNISAPVIVADAETDGNADGIFYADDRVYVAAHLGGLEVFDVTDPENPVRCGGLATPFANDVFVVGSTVYVADRDWGLVIAEEE
mgnify:CR=1 FL=1